MNIVARIILKSPLKIIYEGPISREFIEFNNHYLFALKKIQEIKVISGKLNFSFFFGINRTTDFILGKDRIKDVARIVIVPNPLLFFTWGKVIIPKTSQKFIVEFFDLSKYKFKSLSYSDSHIISSAQPENNERIKFLITSMKLVEKKESTLGQIELYRSQDNRLWQMWFDQNSNCHLENITQQQWSFDFIEARESKINSINSDNTNLTSFDHEYFEMLEEDPRKRKCQEDNCSEICAKGSSLCKKHHFKIITGKEIN